MTHCQQRLSQVSGVPAVASCKLRLSTTRLSHTLTCMPLRSTSNVEQLFVYASTSLAERTVLEFNEHSH